MIALIQEIENHSQSKDKPMKDIFVITIEDVQNIALNKFGRELTEDELHQVKSGIESGLESWEEVVSYAIRDVIESRNKPKNTI
jgi:hypothetical protein